MILRKFALGHSRRALFSLFQRGYLRPFSTDAGTLIKGDIRETGRVETDVNQLDRARIDDSLGETVAQDGVSENYEIQEHVKKTTGLLGSTVRSLYDPHKLATQPPSSRALTLELLMASQVHIGHATSLWNPANQRYIYGIRESLHIISLEATAAHLRRAAKVVEGVAYHGGMILFVGTRPGQSRCVVKAANLAKGYHLFERWIPGSITNGDQILSNCKMRVVDELDMDINMPSVQEKLASHRSLKPDLVVCLNPLENYICLHECGLRNIPTIGIIDTDADPTWVTYPIPANDDSLRSVQLIAGVLGRAGESGQKKRIAAAKTGQVTWETPEFLRDWIKEQAQQGKGDVMA